MALRRKTAHTRSQRKDGPTDQSFGPRRLRLQLRRRVISTSTRPFWTWLMIDSAAGKNHGEAVRAIGTNSERQLGTSSPTKRAVTCLYLRSLPTCPFGWSWIGMWGIGEITDRMNTIGESGFSLLAARTEIASSQVSVAQVDERQGPHQNTRHWSGHTQDFTAYRYLRSLLGPLANASSEPKSSIMSGPPTPLPCLHQPYLDPGHLTLWILEQPPGRIKVMIPFRAHIHPCLLCLKAPTIPNTNR